MNYKVTTQAVRNVFRWYYTTIKADIGLLRNRLVPCLARSLKKKEWLCALPMFGSLAAFVWCLVEMVRDIPEKEPVLQSISHGIGILTLTACLSIYLVFFIAVCAYADEHRYS